MSTLKIKRLTKELKELTSAGTGNDLITVLHADNYSEWIIQLHGAENTLYEGETFLLKVVGVLN